MHSTTVFSAVLICLAAAATGVFAHDYTQFKDFLMKNHLPSGMPRSYAIEPPNYFEKIPKKDRPDHYNKSYRIAPCQNKTVPAQNMNNYMFQTEQMLTGLGLDIYDGAMWGVAMSLLNETEKVTSYMTEVLVKHKTVQFPDIRGDAACNGVQLYDECTDPNQNGVCGFCYGNAKGNAAKTLSVKHAFFFRMISDYWSIEGTVDQRCPDLNMQWTWNDYKPILGENSWANMLGPAQAAMIKYGGQPQNIPDTEPVFELGIPFLTALETMKVGDTGAIFFAPYNTWFGFSEHAKYIGATFSIENQASTLAGLRALHYLVNASSSQKYKSYLPQMVKLMAGLEKILLRAYDKDLGYFRQGGTYNRTTGVITWGQNDEPLFAVDCQTWVSSVLGTKKVDTAFGKGTAYNLWKLVKKTSQYTCPAGGLCGVGYTNNSISGQVFSGEWTYGAINWLRVMMADSGYDKATIKELNNDQMDMYFGLETYLYTYSKINNSTKEYPSVKYANKRYWIPFGWYANPLPATSSTAWAVAVAKGYNPFNVVNGSYANPVY